MNEEIQKAFPRKAISTRRDKRQSTALVVVVVPLLIFGAAYPAVHAASLGFSLAPWINPFLLSLGFAVLVWLLRAATLPASGIGFLICMMISQPLAASTPTLRHTGLPALIMLFLLTFLSTRLGRAKKELRNLAERREGRRASQIVANLGVAALCGLAGPGWYSGCIAALAEATADTVSSEIGQAAGGRTWLLTTWRRVPPGTDGGVSVTGSAAGIVAAGLVATLGMAHHGPWLDMCLVFAASCAGLFFDSVLGATIERRGWLGNDIVNFCSTLFAAALGVVWVTIHVTAAF